MMTSIAPRRWLTGVAVLAALFGTAVLAPAAHADTIKIQIRNRTATPMPIALAGIGSTSTSYDTLAPGSARIYTLTSTTKCATLRFRCGYLPMTGTVCHARSYEIRRVAGRCVLVEVGFIARQFLVP